VQYYPFLLPTVLTRQLVCPADAKPLVKNMGLWHMLCRFFYECSGVTSQLTVSVMLSFSGRSRDKLGISLGLCKLSDIARRLPDVKALKVHSQKCHVL